MKNIKNFNQFINEELSPETYDFLSKYGKSREDLRGKTLTTNAEQLKLKNYPEQIIKIYDETGTYIYDFIPDFTEMEHSSFNDGAGIKLYGKFRKPGHSSPVGIDSKYMFIAVRQKLTVGIGNLLVLLDRKGIRTIVDMVTKKWPDWKGIQNPTIYPSI
jgi:hypothetical protein